MKAKIRPTCSGSVAQVSASPCHRDRCKCGVPTVDIPVHPVCICSDRSRLASELSCHPGWRRAKGWHWRPRPDRDHQLLKRDVLNPETIHNSGDVLSSLSVGKLPRRCDPSATPGSLWLYPAATTRTPDTCHRGSNAESFR